MSTPHYIEQRTPDWFALRCGNLTASAAEDMLATIKKGEAALRRDLRLRLVCERLTGRPQSDGFTGNADTQRGVRLEDVARGAFEARSGQLVDTRVGYLAHDTLRAGCSPDGILPDGSLLEVKAPRVAKHLGYLRSGGAVPPEHRAQLLHQLFVAEDAPRVVFVSYNADLPDHLALFVTSLERNQDEIASYAAKVTAFLHEVDTEVEALLRLKEQV